MAHDIEAALQRLHVAWVGGRAVVRVQFRPLNITRGTTRSQLPSAVDRRSKMGVSFTYANSPVRQALVKAGLYKEILATDPLLTQFRAHLMHDLQMRKRGMATSTVTRVARFFYHIQSCFCPTADPSTAIDVSSLSHREHWQLFQEASLCRRYRRWPEELLRG